MIVNASKHIRPVSSTELRQAILEWRRSQTGSSIDFFENLNPENDGSDDYFVTYEVSFTSSDPERLQIFIFSTKDNFAGVGVETKERVAARCGVPAGRPGFATGHEPGPMNVEQLIALLNCASYGQISLLPKIGFLGLKGAEAMLSREHVALVPVFNIDPHWSWLRVVQDNSEYPETSRLYYKHW